MTPKTREIPTAPRAYTFPRSRPAISVSNMIRRRTSAPQPLYSTHLPPVRMVGVSWGDATRRVVGSKVILPYTTLGTSLTCWKPLRMPSRVVPPCLAAAKQGGTTRDGILKGFQQVKDVPSVVYGKITFDPTTRRVASPQLTPAILTGGKWVEYKG